MKGTELKVRREETGVNQTELAKELGVQRGTVWRWEGSEEEIPKWAAMHVERWFEDDEWVRLIRVARRRERKPEHAKRKEAEKALEESGKRAEAIVAVQQMESAAELYRSTMEVTPHPGVTDPEPEYFEGRQARMGKDVEASRARVRVCRDARTLRLLAGQVGVSVEFLVAWGEGREQMTAEEYDKLQEEEIRQKS
jgi:DNA-binding XRE family transcriptional regulator